jgi:hypothetical protein
MGNFMHPKNQFRDVEILYGKLGPKIVRQCQVSAILIHNEAWFI